MVPIVHWWKRHGSTVHGLSGWRRQWHLMVVSTTQCPTLIPHHIPASVVVFPCHTCGVSCSHLGSQDTGWWAGVGIGMASVVHGVGVMVLIGTVTPETMTYKSRTLYNYIVIMMVTINVTHLFSGDIEPSEDVPLSRCIVCRWSGLSSLSRAIMFHSCRRFLALRTFFTSLCNVPSTQRRCS